MFEPYKATDRRKSARYSYQKNIKYKITDFSHSGKTNLKISQAISKNISTEGILFYTKNPPGLSSIILLDINYRATPIRKELKEKVVIIDGKVLGRIVRVQEEKDNQYSVAVAFVSIKSGLTKQISEMIRKSKIQKTVFFITIFAFAIVVAFASLALNLLYFQFKNTYRPNQYLSLSPKSIGISFEEVDFKTEDGQILNGWFVPSKGAKLSILFCHGNTGNISDLLSRVKFFHNMGVNVLFFDYRGYGKSTGKPTEQGLYNDAVAAYDYLLTRIGVDNNNIVIVGESLGGAVGVNLSLHRNIKALILESTFVSLILEAKDIFPILPVDKLMLEKFDTYSIINKIKIPKLIVHGFDDEVVSFKHAQMLFNKALMPKEFLPFEGGHVDYVFKISIEYKQKLEEFFKKNGIMF